MGLPTLDTSNLANLCINETKCHLNQIATFQISLKLEIFTLFFKNKRKFFKVIVTDVI